MNPWIAKTVILVGTVVMIVIRAPHGRRSRSVKVARSHKTPRETLLLVLAWVGFFVPLIWVVSPAFSFAEYPLRSGPLVAGLMSRDRPVALLSVARRSRHELVGHSGATSGASTYYTGRVSRHPPSDVLGANPLFRRSSPGDPELGGGVLERDRVDGPPCTAPGR